MRIDALKFFNFGMESDETTEPIGDQQNVPQVVNPEDTSTVIDELGANYEEGNTSVPNSDIDYVPEELLAEIEAIEKSADMGVTEITSGEFDPDEVGTPQTNGGLDLTDDTSVTSELYQSAQDYVDSVEPVDVTGNGQDYDAYLRQEFDQIERQTGDTLTDLPQNTTIITEDTVENLEQIGGGDTTVLEEAAGTEPSEVSASDVVDTTEALPGVGDMVGTESDEDGDEDESDSEPEEESDDADDAEEESDESDESDDEAEEAEESPSEDEPEEEEAPAESEDSTEGSVLEEEHAMADSIVVEIQENDMLPDTDIDMGGDLPTVEEEVVVVDDAFSDVSVIADVNVAGAEPLEGTSENVETVTLTEDTTFADAVTPSPEEFSNDPDGINTEEQVDEVEDEITEENKSDSSDSYDEVSEESEDDGDDDDSYTVDSDEEESDVDEEYDEEV